MTTEQQVLSFAPSSDRPDSWLKMKTVDDKGQARDAYIKDKSLAAIVKQPGIYKFTKTKNGQYWEITGVEYVRPLGGAITASSNGTAPPAQRSPATLDVNVVYQNKAVIAEVCVKAAADVVEAALANGGFKADGGIVDLTDVANHAAQLARVFMSECRDFFAAKPEPAKPAAAASAAEGA